MSEKAELIAKMLELQKKFIAYEHENGLSMDEYYTAAEGHPLHNYREEFAELAIKVNSIAHEEKGSQRFY
ncbi:MAG TPA: hypothetical protein ENI68_07320 [Gammaproteobacteria bacterium]|nr:hypothetical protein [Gammaproteobacteria bacterium]